MERFQSEDAAAVDSYGKRICFKSSKHVNLFKQTTKRKA